MNAQTVKEFAKLAMELSASARPFDTAPLSNVSFWCGAGFAKAWEPTSLTGKELFELEPRDFENKYAFDFERILGVDALEGLSGADIRKVNYFLDMNEKYPDIRSRYIDGENIPILRGHMRAAIQKRFARISKLTYIPTGGFKFPPPEGKSQETIREFFSELFRMGHGGAFAEGIRYHFITTNYDFILESILDPLDPEDSFLLYGYRGFTPKWINGALTQKPLHDHMLVHNLLKLNGGFEILASEGGSYELDYRERAQDDILSRPPILMLPSAEQDYSNPYFSAIFPKAIRLLRESRVLVIVGYSLPPEDSLIRFILRQFAEEREDAADKCLFYVDISPRSDRLREIFPWIRKLPVPRVFTYKGGFCEFAASCLAAWSPPRIPALYDGR